MEEKIPNGTKVLVNKQDLPVSKHQPYNKYNNKGSTVEGTIEKSVEWNPGEWRYGIKLGTSKTVFPIRRSAFQIIENENSNK